MEFISLDLIKTLPLIDQIRIKVGVIETNDLSMIPPAYLPPVHSRDYFFVSYSHRDYRKVYPDIFNLQEAGLNLWYDRGIPAGKDWRDIANKYMGPGVCKGVLFYISEASLLSEAVYNEMEYAKAHKKAFFSLNLPFESDYLHNGESVKGKSFSAGEMVDILIENGVDIPEERVRFLHECFPSTVIFLPIGLEAKQRAEKILSSSIDLPKVCTSYKDNGWYTADYATDLSIESLELEDFQAFKDKPNALTAIGRCAFSNCQNLLSAHVSAHSINDYAFFRCVNLTRFENTPNENSKSVNCWNGAFMRCTSLKEIDIGQFAYIGEEAFSTCTALEEAHIEAKLVGRSAFYRCHALRKVYLGKEVATIGQACFDQCDSLEEFIVDPGNAHFFAKEGSLYSKDTGKLLHAVNK